MANKIGIVLALDGEKEFTAAVQSAQKEVKMFQSELKGLSEKFDGQANSMAALTEKQRVLTQQQEAYQRKLDAAKAGQEKANKNYREMGERLEDLRKDLSKAQDALKDMDKGTDAYEKQAKAVQELEKAVEKQTLAHTKEAGSIAQWNQRVNESQRALNKANSELQTNEKYLNEARQASDHCATSIDKMGNKVDDTAKDLDKIGDKAKEAAQKLEDAGEKASVFSDVFTGNLASDAVEKGLDLVKQGADAIKESMFDLSSASANLAAKTGLSETAMRRYRDVMTEIKGDNFGESYGDIADVMAEIVQIMGEMDPSAMKETTESAMTLRDTFDMDVNESIRAADVMMKTMGVDAQTAFDLIAKGAQNGLDRSHELADNITEYGQLWGQMGFSAEEMFSILENGLDAGAYNLDKVNDYVKEFGVSLADGRIEDNIGKFSDRTKDLFEQWKNGGASTRDVFYSVINDLSEMANQQEALTLASEVWSALGEDNAMQVITALDDVNTAYSNVQGTMDKLKDTKYSDLESSISQLGASIQENFLTPIAEKALPLVTDAAQKATEIVEGIGEAIKPRQSEVDTFIEGVQTANEDVDAMLKSAQETLDQADIDVSQLEAYKQTILEINGLENASSLQKHELQTAVQNLAGDIPELAAAWDTEKGKINLTKDAISDLTDKQIEYTKSTAGEFAKQQAENAKMAADANKIAIDSAIKDLESRIEEEEKASGALNEAAILWGTTGLEENKPKIEEYKKELKSLREEQEEANRASELAGIQLEAVNAYVDENTGAINENTDATGDNTDATNDNTDAANANADALDAEMEAAGRAAAAADAQKAALQSVRDEFDSLKEDIQQATDSKISLFDAFDGGDEVSLEDMKTNMQSYADGIRQYYEDLETLSKDVGSGISQEFFQYLSNLGPEGATVIHEITEAWTNGSEEDRRKVQDIMYQFLQSLDASEQGAGIQARNQMLINEAFNVEPPDPAQYDGLFDALDAAVENGGVKVSETTRTAFAEAVEAARQVGAEIPEGISEMISSGNIDSAIAALEGSMQGKLQGLAQMAREAGYEIPPEVAAGIESGSAADLEGAYNTLISALTGQIEAGRGEVKNATDEALSGVEDADAPPVDGVGKEITQGIADDITSSKGVISDAVGEAVSEGANAAAEQTEAYVQAGENLGIAVAEGLSESQDDIAQALSGDTSALSESESAYRQAGEALGDAVVSGIGSKEPDAQGAGRTLGQAAVDSVKEQLDAMRTAAEQAAAQYTAALEAAQAQAASAGGALGSAAYNAAAAWSGSFYSVGANMSAGVASGIAAGASGAVNAARSMAAQALAAAKAELDIHSPSGKFREQVGQQIGKGAAFGIKDSASLAGDEASKMSALVVSKATEWLVAYKKSHKTSLEEEKYYWQQVINHAKQGSAAYNTAVAKMLKSSISTTTGTGKNVKKKEAESYYSEIYSAARQNLENQKILNDWSLKQELNYWTEMQKLLKKGTQAWYDAAREIKNLQTEITNKHNEAVEKQKETARKLKELEQERAQARQEALEEQRRAEAEAAQEAVRAAAQAAVQAREAAKQRIETLKNVHSNLLSSYKVYYKMSAKAEMEYWDVARQQFAAGTAARIEADQNYLAAKEDYYSQQEDLDKDYADRKKEIDDELADSLKDLQDAYDDAVKSREQEIKSSMNLFEAWDAEGYRPDKLIKNLKTQVEGLKFWEQQLQALGKKGLSASLMEELEALGPEAAANIWSLNQMTAEQLEEYQKLWTDKNNLAHKQALKDNEDLLQETQQSIAEARKKAQDAMTDLQNDYRSAVAELNTGMSDGLRMLVTQAQNIGENAVAALIEAVRNGATDVSNIIADAAAEAAAEAAEAAAASGYGSSSYSSSSSSSSSSTGPSEKDQILEVIQTGTKRSSTLTAKEKESHSTLWQRIVKNYGYAVTEAQMKAIADILGIPVSKNMTEEEKKKVRAAMAKKGYARGTRSVEQDELAWLLENSQTEYLLRKSDGAIMQPLRKGDKIVNPQGAEILYNFAENPDRFLAGRIQTAFDMAQRRMAQQQAALEYQMSALDVSGIARLNRMAEQYQPPAPVVNVDSSNVLSMLGTLAASVDRLVSLMEDGQNIVLDTGVLVGELQQPMSQANAAATVRKNRGRMR